ncbi:DNA polymerase-3 subunit epsilon [Allopseudospirillum japonicum]|uniref:DNA-directed DNA polymerase n=1 Tax=Allopseudospirillum japonicum TaxID=64971 RepID=A0A1H6SBU3_9GAMM|nr:3'-5' exonuclease [Allopseudospirillum japonicum]SEI61490.1 DNA polymerase-3 subunit epsilon [Allopseudospirillum japonicum]
MIYQNVTQNMYNTDVLSNLACLDIEATGLYTSESRITEIGLILIDQGQVVRRWQHLVNPQTQIPQPVQALTRITMEMVQDAPVFADLAQDLAHLLKGRVLVAHNARFDYGYLYHEFARLGYRYHTETLCTLRLSRKLYPKFRHHSLEHLIRRHHLRRQARHRALGDALTL